MIDRAYIFLDLIITYVSYTYVVAFYLNYLKYLCSSTTVFYTYSSCPIIQSYQIISVAIFHARKGEGKSFLSISWLFDIAEPVEGLKISMINMDKIRLSMEEILLLIWSKYGGERQLPLCPPGSAGPVGWLIVGCRCPDGTIKHHLYSKKCQGVKKQRETSRQPVVSPFSNFASFLSKEPW